MKIIDHHTMCIQSFFVIKAVVNTLQLLSYAIF